MIPSITRRIGSLWLAVPVITLLTLINAQTPPCQYCELYSLAFSDEFDGTALDTSVWNYRTDIRGTPAEGSVQMPTNIAVDEGNLTISLLNETTVTPQGTFKYTGGGIVSIQNYQYGYVEARVQINSGPGWHTTLWLFPGDGSRVVTPPATGLYTEIDVMELLSSDPTKANHNVFGWNATSPTTAVKVRDNADTGNHFPTGANFTNFYVFGASWNETDIDYFVNGVHANQHFEYNPQGSYGWIHDYLNIWMTTVQADAYANPALLPAYVNVDYIRYWQRDFYLTSHSLCNSLAQGSTPCPSNATYAETGSNWNDSTTVTGYTDTLGTRQACSSYGPTASWTKTVPYAGTYTISAWILARSDSDSAAYYTVIQNGVSVATVTINQTSGATKWDALKSNLLVAAGDNIVVTVRASGNGCLRADTVKIVRVA